MLTVPAPPVLALMPTYPETAPPSPAKPRQAADVDIAGAAFYIDALAVAAAGRQFDSAGGLDLDRPSAGTDVHRSYITGDVGAEIDCHCASIALDIDTSCARHRGAAGGLDVDRAGASGVGVNALA